MAAQIRKPDLIELPPYQNLSRIQRLQNLVCAGGWSGNSNIIMTYWVADVSKAGGGYWVAWQDSPQKDPLSEASVSVSP